VKTIFRDFTEGNILLKEHTKAINNKIKLHILGAPMNKLGKFANSQVLKITAHLSK